MAKEEWCQFCMNHGPEKVTLFPVISLILINVEVRTLCVYSCVSALILEQCITLNSSEETKR